MLTGHPSTLRQVIDVTVKGQRQPNNELLASHNLYLGYENLIELINMVDALAKALDLDREFPFWLHVHTIPTEGKVDDASINAETSPNDLEG